MKHTIAFAVAVLLFAAACSAPASNTTGPAAILAAAQAPTAMPVETQAPAQAPTAENATGQTFNVLVGGEDTSVGAEFNGFFPATLHIHVGDTVLWKQNAHEIHTVTFLAGQPVPDLLVPVPNGPQGAMMFNPQVAFPAGSQDGKYDGSGAVNSGIMGMDTGQAPQFSLTFTKPGTYQYVCVVHNMMKMAGTIVVEDSSASIPSQADDDAQAQKELDALKAQVPDIVKAANAQTKPDVQNPDGSTTHYVSVGYAQGQIDMTAFFPNNVSAKAGDTIVWNMPAMNMAPHTITILNGAPEPDLLAPQPQPNGPPFLLISPAVALPQNADKPLTNQGIYNSGILDPSAPGDHAFSLKLGTFSGSLEFVCLLHDENGMKGTITMTQ